MHLGVIVSLVLACGAIGGLVNAFIGDNSFHLPTTDGDDVWRPGFIGIVFVGMIAAFGSWATLKSVALFGGAATSISFSTGDLANALVIGFGGTKWWKSEGEKDVLQKTAAVAAGKSANPTAAAEIAAATPLKALSIAKGM